MILFAFKGVDYDVNCRLLSQFYSNGLGLIKEHGLNQIDFALVEVIQRFYYASREY